MAKLLDVGSVALLMALCGARCSVPVDPEEPVPAADCGTACSNLEALSCPEAEPTEDGASCAEVCANGMAERYDLGCLGELLDCSLDLCEIP
jgi:hypothetical protein